MDVVDEAVLTILRATMPTPEQVHVSEVLIERAAPGTPVVVRYELPYVVYTSNVGDRSNPRLAGRNRRLSTFWSLKFVGETHEQTKYAGQVVQEVLTDVRLDIPGYRMWPTQLLESQRIFRDDDAIRPDGSPLFYGVDNYAAALVIKQAA